MRCSTLKESDCVLKVSELIRFFKLSRINTPKGLGCSVYPMQASCYNRWWKIFASAVPINFATCQVKSCYISSLAEYIFNQCSCSQNPFKHPHRPCKKPLSPSCTVQMSDTKDSPAPIPLLAAALGADTRTVLLAYGNHLQPVMEKVVSTQKGGVSETRLKLL